MTNQEFKKLYGFRKPTNAKDRDMVIMSNLSDLQFLLKIVETQSDLADIQAKINSLKSFIQNSQK